MRRLFAVLSAMCLLAGPLTSSASAQSFEVLADFGQPEGMQPIAGVIQGSDGQFYGTTAAGGTGEGTIYKVSATGAITTLYLFNGTDGSRPEAALIQGWDGNFYGTTRFGGTYGKGVVFKFNPAGAGTLTVLRSFAGSDGEDPRGALVQGNDGNLYGTTSLGGLLSCGTTCGTIFRISTAGSFATLVKFAKTNGGIPVAGLTKGSDGRLYGTTSKGGANDRGTVFVFDPFGALTTLHQFSLAEGMIPYAGLIQAPDGYFYGATFLGGAYSKGTIYRIGAGGGLVALHSFSGVEGGNPRAALVRASDGRLYGITSTGGSAGKGTVFSLPLSGPVTALRSLGLTDGSNSYATPVEGSAGVLYGTASVGGPPGSAGTLFKVTTSGAFTLLHAFKGSPVKPYAALVEGSDGVLRGTTHAGGGSNKGTIFTVDAFGNVDLVHAFSGSDGANPVAPVAHSKATGLWYGTTSKGGATQAGSIVKFSATAPVSLVMSLSSTTGFPTYSGLVETPDGSEYGTTYIGGIYGSGTIVKVTATGITTAVHNFSSAGGINPYGAMALAPNGLLYGTTMGGGANGVGVIFSFDPVSGAYTRRASFVSATGMNPRAELTYASDGFFYGTAPNGGAYGFGTIFRFDPATNALTTLYSFSGSDGANPYAAVVEASDGLLYGTTYLGGASSFGTVFQFDRATRRLTTVKSFSGSNGAYPQSALVQSRDGRLYGTAGGGGSSGNGVVYRLTPGAAPAPTFGVALTAPNGGETLSTTTAYSVQWTVSGTASLVSSFELQFSSNGGATFTPVAGCTSLSSAARSCTWASPGPATTTGRMRVVARDSAGTMTTDDSNANFTVAAPETFGVTLTTPNGGETLTTGTPYTVQWSVSGTASLVSSFDLQFAADGTTFGSVTGCTGLSSAARSCTWASPGPATTTGRMRIVAKDAAGKPVSDDSNANFTIAAPATFGIALTAPNGGETLTTGVPYLVTWSVSGTASLAAAFDLQFSSDGGGSFTAIIGCTGLASAARSCTWASPGPVTTLGRIRLVVRDTSGNYRSDDSDGNFTIAAAPTFAVALTTPNGGETLTAGAPYSVQWAVSGTASLAAAFDLQFSSNGGSSFTPVIGCTGLASAARSCTWASPGPATTAGRMRLVVRDTAGNYTTDDSNGNFTIAAAVPSPTSLFVTAPNTAVNWGIGSLQAIKWTHSLGIGAYVKIELSRDGGGTWEILAASRKNSTDTAGLHYWTVTGPATSRARIRITAVDGSATDTNDVDFTIAAPYVTVTTPNVSSTVWTVGQKVSVNYLHNLGFENVTIELSKDGGLTYPVILVPSIAATGSASVLVDASWVTSAARVRVKWVRNTTVNDSSDAAFAIR